MQTRSLRRSRSSCKAEKLVLLSDVDGIYLRAGDPETKLSQLTATEAADLIQTGAAAGGMIPKLKISSSCSKRGVGSAHIINGNTRNSLLAEVFTDEGTGTMISAS
jgi:acetylglutamate kinase